HPTPPLLQHLLPAPHRRTAHTGTDSGTGADGSLADRLATLTPEQQHDTLLALARTQIATVLGHQAPEAVPADSALRDLGFDSLTAVELRNRLARVTGLRLPATLAFDHPTATALTRHLLTRLLPDDADTAPPELSLFAELGRLEAALSSAVSPLPGAEGLGGEARSRLASRLRSLAQALGGEETPRPDLGEATDEEMFALIDQETETGSA
ncbi:hypothetical protein GTU99_32995, partial [Streptomyces sp. PRKS01-65]